MTIPDDQIQDIALAAGFTLKPQPDGGMALHPHVFEFARAMISAGQQAAQDQIADLLQQLEQSSESFQVAILSSGMLRCANRCSAVCSGTQYRWHIKGDSVRVGFDVANAQADAIVRNPVACPAKNLVEHLVAGMPRSAPATTPKPLAG